MKGNHESSRQKISVMPTKNTLFLSRTTGCLWNNLRDSVKNYYFVLLHITYTYYFFNY